MSNGHNSREHNNRNQTKGCRDGVLIGMSRTAREMCGPTVEILRPIPPAAVIPVAILFLGIHDGMKIAVIIFGSIWPVLVNTAASVEGIDKVLVDTGRLLNLGRVRFLWKIVLKGASPYIAAGLRISPAISLILSVVTEMIAGNDGPGFFIMLSERSFQTREMYAGIVAIALIGYLMNYLYVRLVEAHVMKWYKGYTTQL